MCKEGKIRKMGFLVELITLGNAAAITLAPFGIYMKTEVMPPYWGYKRIANHEQIHWKQQLEMLIIFFYVWYLIEWALKFFLPPFNEAYKAISFEREAYDNDDNLTYLETRKHFAWIKRIFK